MIKVLVVGYIEKIEEFRLLTLQNAKVEFLDQADLDLMEIADHVSGEEMINDEDWDNIMGGEDPDGLWGGEPQEGYISGRTLDYENYDVIFDLNLDDNPENILNYTDLEDVSVFGCAVKKSLAEIVESQLVDVNCKLFGMNALSTFIHRPKLEVSLFNASEKPDLEKVLYELSLNYELVDDRPGMVSARIICMIINEAFFMMNEGTAGAKEIDLAMKLGTNYPMGPMEWANKIGYVNVENVLRALQNETGDPKYKISPLLVKYALLGKQGVK